MLTCLIILLNVNTNGCSFNRNLNYYYLIVVELICVELIRDFAAPLAEALRENPHVKCRELLVGNAENITGN